MRQSYQRAGENTQHMSPMAVASEARWMLEQLSLPVDPRDSIKARRERAIRRAGISPAKGMRLWYSQTCSLLAHEFLAICDAYKTHVKNQETRLHEEIAILNALKARGANYEMDLPASARSVAEMDNAP